MSLNPRQEEAIFRTLDAFRIELPSWAFANTGTRFGKFLDPTAAATIDEKLADAAQVHRFTGCCPSVAVHVLWDFPGGVPDAAPAAQRALDLGVRIGSVSPNVFQDQEYKYGSLANPDPAIRAKALDHILDSIEMAKAAGSRDITPWFTDGSNYPGTANMRQHKRWFEEGLRAAHATLAPDQRLLIEYKPFEPAFYHTDIADWGMALQLAKAAIVDHERLAGHQRSCSLIDAEECLQTAFQSDVRPAIEEWRRAKGLPVDPLAAFRESGYLRRIAEERGGRAQAAASYA